MRVGKDKTVSRRIKRTTRFSGKVWLLYSATPAEMESFLAWRVFFWQRVLLHLLHPLFFSLVFYSLPIKEEAHLYIPAETEALPRRVPRFLSTLVLLLSGDERY